MKMTKIVQKLYWNKKEKIFRNNKSRSNDGK